MAASSPPASADTATERLLERLRDARWQRLVLSRPHGAAAGDLQRVTVRPIVLKGAPAWQFVSTHATRDLTQNHPPAAALALVRELLDTRLRNAHLFEPEAEWQLLRSKKGHGHLVRHAREGTVGSEDGAPAPAGPPATDAAHDRAKQRWLPQDAPFLVALGVTTPSHQVVPAMARKWKQINRFVEILAGALERSPLAGRSGLRVVDFGAGKAYLTFAVHHWLHAQGLAPQVTGVELRPDLVEGCNAIVRRLGLQGLQLVQGDVQRWPAGPMDVMIALHACDTATDHAIHLGLQAGAQVIVCSPCCHKQLRPQLLSPHPLKSVFQHGIHAEQQAEMLTDTLRALLLQAQGYDTQVFEFVSLEHTAKNKMILAVKRPQPLARQRDDALAQVQALKQFFGVREQRLEDLLSSAAADPAPNH